MLRLESCTVDSLAIDDVSKTVVINQITITNPTFYAIIIEIATEEERKQFIERILSIGFDVVQTIGERGRVDYINAEFEKMIKDFETKFSQVFSDDGEISELLEAYFGAKGDVTCLLSDHFGDEGTIVRKLLNPSDIETPLGRFKRDLENLLDVSKEGSAFNQIKACVETCFASLSEQIKIRDEVGSAVAEERERGTAKGRDFQEFLTEVTDGLARPLEDTVTFVGDDPGLVDKKGDVLVEINPSNTKGIEKRIIIEAKNSPVTLSGKNTFLNELDEAMVNRTADYAIGAIFEPHTPRSVGAFRRYARNKILVSIPEDYPPIVLEVAYKVARSEIIAKTLADEAPIDAIKIIEIAERAKAKLENMRAIRTTINRTVTDLSDVHTRLGTMETEIKEELNELTILLQTQELEPTE